jgi:hypothetical protein
MIYIYATHILHDTWFDFCCENIDPMRLKHEKNGVDVFVYSYFSFPVRKNI